MTQEEKKRMVELKESGMGYKRIAACTGLPIGTVKSFFLRHQHTPQDDIPRCLQCGEPITAGSVRREKKFCSDQCRMRWWAAHPELMNRKTGINMICPQCGKTFIVYGKKKRVYCSRLCYSLGRKARNHGNE